MYRKQIVLIAMILLVFTACQRMAAREHSDDLNTAVIHYGADLRWGRYTDAYSYHIYRDGTRPKVDFENLKNIKVTSVEAIKPTINNDEVTEATVPFKIDYYDERYSTVNTINQTQYWWYNKEVKRWFIESDFPDLK